jgi:hypothetical protein
MFQKNIKYQCILNLRIYRTSDFSIVRYGTSPSQGDAYRSAESEASCIAGIASIRWYDTHIVSYRIVSNDTASSEFTRFQCRLSLRAFSVGWVYALSVSVEFTRIPSSSSPSFLFRSPINFIASHRSPIIFSPIFIAREEGIAIPGIERNRKRKKAVESFNQKKKKKAVERGRPGKI